MIIPDGKKKNVTIIGPGDESPELQIAAEDILSAIKSDSAEELKAALKAFIEMSEMGPAEESEME